MRPKLPRHHPCWATVLEMIYLEEWEESWASQRAGEGCGRTNTLSLLAVIELQN